MEHVLLAVADTAASLAAARAAVSLAARLGAELRVIHVVPDGELAAAIGAVRHRPHPTEDRDPAASPLLRHVAASAERAGVPVSTVRHEGDVTFDGGRRRRLSLDPARPAWAGPSSPWPLLGVPPVTSRALTVRSFFSCPVREVPHHQHDHGGGEHAGQEHLVP